MRLDELINALATGSIPRRAVVITFDDGYIDNLRDALPVLKQHGAPATVFIASGYVGSDREYWWDELDRVLLQPGRLPPRLVLEIGSKRGEWNLGNAARISTIGAWKARHWRAWNETDPTPRHAAYREIWHMMRGATTAEREAALEALRSWAGIGPRGRSDHLCVSLPQLQELAASDLIEIGAHTVTHPSLGAIDRDEQRREIVESRRALEHMLSREISSFAYPFGSRSDYSEVTVGLLKEAGFKRACSNFPAVVTDDVDAFQIPRRVAADWTGSEFVQRLATWFAETADQPSPMPVAAKVT